MCNPKTTSNFGASIAPSLIMSGAPPSSLLGAPSSAGWNKKTTVPARSFCISFKALAVAINIAVCAS